MPRVSEGQRVRILYTSAHQGEAGTITRIVERTAGPSLMHVQIDNGPGFICDETMVEPCQASS